MTGTTPIAFSWIKTNLKRSIQDFSSDSRYTVYSDGRLTISNPDHTKDDGYYHCVARNSAGTIVSKGAQLRVPCKYCQWLDLNHNMIIQYIENTSRKVHTYDFCS